MQAQCFLLLLFNIFCKKYWPNVLLIHVEISSLYFWLTVSKTFCPKYGHFFLLIFHKSYNVCFSCIWAYLILNLILFVFLAFLQNHVLSSLLDVQFQSPMRRNFLFSSILCLPFRCYHMFWWYRIVGINIYFYRCRFSINLVILL